MANQMDMQGSECSGIQEVPHEQKNSEKFCAREENSNHIDENSNTLKCSVANGRTDVQCDMLTKGISYTLAVCEEDDSEMIPVARAPSVMPANEQQNYKIQGLGDEEDDNSFEDLEMDDEDECNEDEFNEDAFSR